MPFSFMLCHPWLVYHLIYLQDSDLIEAMAKKLILIVDNDLAWIWQDTSSLHKDIVPLYNFIMDVVRLYCYWCHYYMYCIIPIRSSLANKGSKRLIKAQKIIINTFKLINLAHKHTKYFKWFSWQIAVFERQINYNIKSHRIKS